MGAMRSTDTRLEELLGKKAGHEVIARHAVQPALQENGDEMFTLDFLSIGRGYCQRCGTCACLKWIYNIKNLRCSRCTKAMYEAWKQRMKAEREAEEGPEVEEEEE